MMALAQSILNLWQFALLNCLLEELLGLHHILDLKLRHTHIKQRVDILRRRFQRCFDMFNTLIVVSQIKVHNSQLQQNCMVLWTEQSSLSEMLQRITKIVRLVQEHGQVVSTLKVILLHILNNVAESAQRTFYVFLYFLENLVCVCSFLVRDRLNFRELRAMLLFHFLDHRFVNDTLVVPILRIHVLNLNGILIGVKCIFELFLCQVYIG